MTYVAPPPFETRMLSDHYGFREHPFRMTPDARMYFPSSVHSRAHAHLIYGLAQMEGFIVITGEVGSGKTMLVEHLCAELDPAQFAVARIATTQVSGADLLQLLAEAIGASAEGSKGALLRAITATLASRQVRQLLIVDEAQGLPREALEELRMLSNLSAGGRALLQIVLVGQPQLRQTLTSPDLEQLHQRILASYHLGPLSPEETCDYVRHRMRAAGWDGQHPSVEEDALRLVHTHSGGLPRRMNRLFSRVLLAGGLERADHLTAELVEATALEMDDDLGGGGPVVPHAVAAAPVLDRLQQLTERLELLEQTVARREYVFNRFRDLLSGRRDLP